MLLDEAFDWKNRRTWGVFVGYGLVLGVAVGLLAAFSHLGAVMLLERQPLFVAIPLFFLPLCLLGLLARRGSKRAAAATDLLFKPDRNIAFDHPDYSSLKLLWMIVLILPMGAVYGGIMQLFNHPEMHPVIFLLAGAFLAFVHKSLFKVLGRWAPHSPDRNTAANVAGADDPNKSI